MSALAAARETAFAGEVELTCPFREGLVEALKEIPARYRSWDAGEKTWRVREPHAQAAVDLLVEHFPGATIPETYRRLAPVVVTERPSPRDARVAALAPAPRPAPDEPAPLVARVPCPTCRVPYDQPIRVVAETSARVAKRDKTPPELLAVCPRCRGLAVVAVYPAVLPAPEPS